MLRFLKNVFKSCLYPPPPPAKINPAELPSIIQDYIISDRINKSANIEAELTLLGNAIANCISQINDHELLKILGENHNLGEILVNSRGISGIDLILYLTHNYLLYIKNNSGKLKLSIIDIIKTLLRKIYINYLELHQIPTKHPKWHIPILLLRDFGNFINKKIKLFNLKPKINLIKVDNYPLISLIIPIYNVEDYVEKCLESALRQNYSNLEILIIDDCSTDKSMEVVNKVIKKYPERNALIISHTQNKGLGAARNTGIAQAKGEYIMFLDSDDYISQGYINSLLHFTLTNKLELTCGAVLCLDANNKIYREQYFNMDIYLSKQKHYLYYRNSATEEQSDLFSNAIFKFPDVAWAKLYHRRIFQHMKFPEGLIHEDFGFFIPTLTIIQSIGYYTDCENYYFYRRQREGSIMMNKTKRGSKILDIVKISQFIMDNIIRLAPQHRHDAIELRLNILHNNIANWLEFPSVSETICREFYTFSTQINQQDQPFAPSLQKKLDLYKSQNLSWKGIFFLRMQKSLRMQPELSFMQLKSQLEIWINMNMHKLKLNRLPKYFHKACKLIILGIAFSYVIIKILFMKIFKRLKSKT